MSIFRRSGSPAGDAPGISGTVRFGRATGDLAAGMRPGDIAVIDRPDLDREGAEQLVAAQVAAVVNAAASSTGRYPNLGPQVLADAGIALVDSAGQGILTRLRSGDRIRVEDGKIYRDEILVGTGTDLDAGRTRAHLSEASTELTTRLDSLAVNASDHLRREHAMLLEGARIPRLRTRFRRRPVIVVSHAFDAKADLAGLRRFILDRDPVLIGAGSGADLLLDAGLEPHVVVGELDNLSSRAIAKSDEVVVTTASGEIIAPERLEKHGKEVIRFVADGNDTDLALLLADAGEPDVIVHVGAPPTLMDFLEQGSGLVGPSFVVRLRAGARIVDAKAVHHFMTGRISAWPVALLLLAGLAAVAVAVSVTPAGSDLLDSVADLWGDFRSWIEGLFS